MMKIKATINYNNRLNEIVFEDEHGELIAVVPFDKLNISYMDICKVYHIMIGTKANGIYKWLGSYYVNYYDIK